jgi:hypothetical protein
MGRLYHLFYQRLPVRRVETDEHLHLLNDKELRNVNRSQRFLMTIAASLSVLGFLGYYLPIYRFPQLFPFINIALPAIGTFKFPWAELLWCIFLTSIELYLLVLLNIAGVHEIAVATGFIKPEIAKNKPSSLLEIGLEKKAREISEYGIDPFQGLNKWALLIFNSILRIKGWLGNQIIRFIFRMMLGRYAVRAFLDFSGLPLYMAINAFSVHAVLREARVIIMGRIMIRLILQQLPQLNLQVSEKKLLYDTLQFIAVSKRDFHQNHYLLTKSLLDFFKVPVEHNHPLPDNYFETLSRASDNARTICQLVIVLGFILDGKVSNRERLKIRRLNRLGILQESYTDLKKYCRDFLRGAGVDSWIYNYFSRITDSSAAGTRAAMN